MDKLSPDILCLQEIKAQQSDVEKIQDKLFDNQYEQIVIHSADRKGYSGTATFSSMQAQAYDFLDRNSSKVTIDTMNEGRIIESDFNDFILFNIYFPNGQSGQDRLDLKMKFYADFLDYIQDLQDQNKKIIICGDVNTAHCAIDLARPKENENISGFLKIEREWIDELLSNGFQDSFRVFYPEKPKCYTWWSYRTAARSRNIGWRIDYFIISDNLQDRLKDAFILDNILGSDHCPIGVELII